MPPRSLIILYYRYVFAKKLASKIEQNNWSPEKLNLVLLKLLIRYTRRKILLDKLLTFRGIESNPNIDLKRYK